MNEKKVIIKGYQPVMGQEGYQPEASVQKVIRGNTKVSTPIVMVNIKPPKGGTGEVKKK